MASIRKREWSTARGMKKVAYVVDYVDGRGSRQRQQFSRWKEADRFRIKIENQLAVGTYRPDADKVTVRDLCEAYLEHCQGRMERNERMTRKMLAVYRGHVYNHILHSDHGLGPCKLSQLTAKGVGDFRDGIRSAGMTVPTSRKVLSTLHAALEYAISQDWVAVNAAHGVKVIAPRDEGSKKIKAPSKADLKALIASADDDLRFMVLFAASTGLRAGEQWAVRWGDIDTATGMLSVERRVDAYGEEGPPKSAAGVRGVPLSSFLLRSLKEWRLQSKFSGDDDLVFPNKKGRYMGHDNLVKRRFKPALAAAEVSEINWHSLRHYAVSTWIEAGLAPKTVQTFAGHSSLSVTMDRYGHLFPSDDHKAAMDAIAGELMDLR
jgi:integrase